MLLTGTESGSPTRSDRCSRPQTAHSAMVAQQLYMENARLDLTDYKRAKAIHDNREITESGAEAMKNKGSVSGNFIDAILGK